MTLSKGHLYLLILFTGLLLSVAMLLFGNEIVGFLEIGIGGKPFLEAIGYLMLYTGLLTSGNHFLQKIRFFNIPALIQNLLLTGLLMLVIYQLPSLLEKFDNFYFVIDHPLFFYIKPLLLTLYSIYMFSMFGRLVFVQKPKQEDVKWKVFLGVILFSTLIFFIPFTLYSSIFYVYGSIILCFTVYFSFSYKWINLLAKNEMLYILALIVPINLINAYFFYGYLYHSDLLTMESPFNPNIFFYSINSFVLIYGTFSMLALLFQLPMQSQEEKRSKDIGNIFGIQELIVKKPGVEHIFNYLFDSSAEASKVEAGWIKFKVEDDFKLKTRNINFNHIEKIEEFIRLENQYRNEDFWVIFDLTQKSEAKKLKIPYHSMAYFRFEINSEIVMEMVLIDSGESKFDEYIFQILLTYYNQTKLAYENKLLLEERLSSEVIKNELQIAKDIQMQMIPENPPQTTYCEFHAVTRPANEVGGDFYDYYINNKNELFLLIGDVTGKGLPAAIHTAEVKGIIQTLIQFDISVEEFMVYLNNAVCNCFQKHMFFTLNVIKIDPVLRKITYVRGGHCPLLYYHNLSGLTEYFDEKGMGAGIIRNNTYSKYFSVLEKHYQKGDLFVLITDGYIESVNPMTGEEFGYERMEMLLKNADKSSPKTVIDHINKSLENYAGTKHIDDDLLIVAGKFN